MVAILFGPYLLVGLVLSVLCLYWATIADVNRDKARWMPFHSRSPESYRKAYGDRPPY